MTTSGSMPFSLASASIVCCSGFDMSKIPLPDWPAYHVHRHAMRLPVLGINQHVAPVDTAEHPPEEPLSVDAFAHHELGAPAREPPIVVGVAQRPVESRRRYFQRVGNGHDVLDVEDGAEIAAAARAILHADAVLGGRRRPGS